MGKEGEREQQSIERGLGKDKGPFETRRLGNYVGRVLKSKYQGILWK